MKVLELEIEKIKPYQQNAKLHDEKQIENVAESIKKYGFQQPLVVSKDYELIIGHCRLLASKALGLKTVPVVIADKLTDKQVKELRLIDNKTNESEWDLDLLSLELEDLDLSDFDIDWGIQNFNDEFDETDLDIEEEKTKVNCSIHFLNVNDYEKIKEEIDTLALKVGATVSVKME